jgi:mannose-1-phosphate guanylyltransferase/mannose-1-phosphate guanylyltransferase/mannose-6-phosphate isomerase
MELNNQPAFVGRSDGGPVGVCADDLPTAGDYPSQNLVVPVILSGGAGTRLWPFSTKQRPKQFLALIDDKTLFEETLNRVRDRTRFAAPIVVTSIDHAELCRRYLDPEGEAARVILEPCARNTAPAILMAAVIAQELYGDEALILVTPSDHIIEDVSAFHKAVRVGEAAAKAGRLVAFGIHPTAAETGYGYLQTGDEVQGAAGVKDVVRFVEKPQRDVAQAMVAAGDHLWNAGIFLLPVKTLFEEAMLTCRPIAESARKAIDAGRRQGNCVIPDAGLLQACRADSIDYAVLESSSRVAVVPMSPGWSDVGSWDALAEIVGSSSQAGPVTAIDCENCYIRSDGVEIAALGVRDLIIVASGGKLLIMPRGRSQEVKKLLSAMDLMVA